MKIKKIIFSLIAFIGIMGFSHNVFADSLIGVSSIVGVPVENLNQNATASFSFRAIFNGTLSKAEFIASCASSYASCDTSTIANWYLRNYGNSTNLDCLSTTTYGDAGIGLGSGYSFNFPTTAGFITFTGTQCDVISGNDYIIVPTSNGSGLLLKGDESKNMGQANLYSASSPETCTDGIENQNEIGIDIGGVCTTSGLEFISPAIGSNVNSPVTFTGTFTNTISATAIYFFIKQNNMAESETYKLVNITGESGSFTTNIILPNGSYWWTARLVDMNTMTYGEWYPTENSHIWYFGVNQQPFVTDLDEYNLIFTSTCDVEDNDLYCAIKKGGAWFMTVSDATITDFKSITLRYSFPFSYIYDIGTIYGELFDTSTPQDIDITIPFLTGEITLISTDKIEAVPFASLIRVIMGALIYFGTIFTIYHLIINIHHKDAIVPVK